jgi:hypothetical protein
MTNDLELLKEVLGVVDAYVEKASALNPKAIRGFFSTLWLPTGTRLCAIWARTIFEPRGLCKRTKTPNSFRRCHPGGARGKFGFSSDSVTKQPNYLRAPW